MRRQPLLFASNRVPNVMTLAPIWRELRTNLWAFKWHLVRNGHHDDAAAAVEEASL